MAVTMVKKEPIKEEPADYEEPILEKTNTHTHAKVSIIFWEVLSYYVISKRLV